ncbi:Glycopeptide antibiotics resistance protein [Nocardioides sp. YR527]|uniref:VanZ family protein n=1 Tax=Nocardioides sp. YR527 TaxID=1881028 RepID=UPI00088EAABC|nr:VanZ family protein [Nocardioides sp. YR527]SDK51183.1 Glycopeptide antibiotics resistance protein [Nocardioides sp. YR527]
MIVNESGTLTETGVVLLTMLAFPVAVLAVPVLAALRRIFGVAWRRAWRHSLAEVAIVYGTVPGVLLTLLPGNNGILSGNVSLVPFEDMSTMGPIGLYGNLLIFAALGFFGPIRFPALRSVWRVLVLATAASVSIEVLQHLLPIGRVSSVDDVILNAGGATVAAVLSWPWWRRRRQISAERPRDLVEAGSA